MHKSISKAWEIRLIAILVIIISIVMGLSSRKFPSLYPVFLAQYLGDTVWALCFFALLRALLIKLKNYSIFLIALDFAFLIELSQLWHPLWLDVIRRTFIGGLVLGFGFIWTDLICYVAGCLIGWLIFSLTLRQVSFSS